MLDKAGLKAGIIQLHSDMSEREENSIEEYAERLSTIIDTFVKTGSVAAGIPVNTTGTAAAQTGATTDVAAII